MTSGSSSDYGVPHTNNSYISPFKGGHGMDNLYPHLTVDEESSNSENDMEDDDCESLEQFGPMEFNPKCFYWIFNYELKFSSRPGFSHNDDINPNDFMEMRRVNRRILAHFFKILGERQIKRVPMFNSGPCDESRENKPSMIFDFHQI